jgi:hypothetical protein
MNFYFEQPTPNLKSLYEIAGTLVATFGRVFEMQPDETLAYHAPLVKQLRATKASAKFCTPQVS